MWMRSEFKERAFLLSRNEVVDRSIMEGRADCISIYMVSMGISWSLFSFFLFNGFFLDLIVWCGFNNCATRNHNDAMFRFGWVTFREFFGWRIWADLNWVCDVNCMDLYLVLGTAIDYSIMSTAMPDVPIRVLFNSFVWWTSTIIGQGKEEMTLDLEIQRN